MKSSIYMLIFSVVLIDVIPQRTSSSPLIRVLRSPDTTPESHISNFLHQHRSDSRADKPELKPDNSTDPQHRRPSKPKTTTTEPPISQTELLVNLIHNTIVTVREQFPSIIGAISSPSNPPSTTKHPKKFHHALHQTHAHIMQERSTNATSAEDEATESGETSAGSGEDEDEVIDEEEEDVEQFPPSNNAAALIPPALIRTIVEASGSSAARGSAGASAGSAASTIAGASSSSSAGTGRSARQADEGSQGSGSGEFLFSIISNKIRGLTSLFISPIFSASRFFQRSFGALSSGSSGGDPEPDPRHRHAGDNGHRHSDGDHHHHHGSDHHSDHHHEHHDHRSGDHHSDGQDHHSHHHSGDHGHHSNGHNNGHNHNSTPVDDSANLILGNDEVQDNGRKFYYRDAPYNATDMNSSSEFQSNETITNEISSEESSNDDGPLRIVLDNGGLDADDEDNDVQRRIIVRKTREAKALFSEGFGIYILEIFGSIAGLTWGAIHQISHIFQGRSDEPDEFY